MPPKAWSSQKKNHRSQHAVHNIELNHIILHCSTSAARIMRWWTLKLPYCMKCSKACSNLSLRSPNSFDKLNKLSTQLKSWDNNKKWFTTSRRSSKREHPTMVCNLSRFLLWLRWLKQSEVSSLENPNMSFVDPLIQLSCWINSIDSRNS